MPVQKLLVPKLEPKLNPLAPPAAAPAAAPANDSHLLFHESKVPPPPPGFGAGTAPNLPPANLNGFSLDVIQMFLARTNVGMSNERMNSSMETVKSLNIQKDNMAYTSLHLTEQANQAEKDAQDAADKAKIVNWVVTVGVAIGAVGMTMATGGVGAAAGLTALMGAAAITSLVLQQLNVQVASPADGQKESLDLTVGGAVKAAVDALVGSGAIITTHVENGKTVDNHGNEITDTYKAAHPNALIVDADTLSTATMVAGIAASLIVQGGIGKLAANSLAKAGKAAEAAGDIEGATRKAGQLERLGQALSVAGGFTEGGGSVAHGAITLKGAEADLSKDQTNAQKDYVDGKEEIVTQKVKRQFDIAAKVAEDSSAMLGQITENIAGEYALIKAINSNV
jgi:hypothetical protein